MKNDFINSTIQQLAEAKVTMASGSVLATIKAVITFGLAVDAIFYAGLGATVGFFVQLFWKWVISFTKKRNDQNS